MGTIEQDLWECEKGCRSDKVTERRKSMERLASLLDDYRTISLLNRSTSAVNSRNHNGNLLSWDDLFLAVHTLILKEAEKLRADKQKGQSASGHNLQENIRLRGCALIDKLVTKSKGFMKCSTVVDKIIIILKDGYLRKCFGRTYLLILKSVLDIRKYWGQISYDFWTELLNICFQVYEKPPPGMDKALMSEILNRIIKCGCAQSHLGLHLRKKFTFLVKAFEDSTLGKFPALQTSLLKLAIIVSQQLARESRMATCKFGEDVVKCVVGLYEQRMEDSSNKKGFMFDFLLLQMQLHHPHGAKEGEGAAYAYNWEKWREHLKAIYVLVDAELHNVQKNKNKIHELKDNFLQLAVEICKQIFQDSNNVLDVTNILALNDTITYSMAKRRRVVAGIQAIMDSLNQDTWPWVSVVSSLLLKYPHTLKQQEYIQLLRQLAELQSSCKDSTVMRYLCLCCTSLLKVEEVMDQRFINMKEDSLQWQKISETTLRTVGLNQCVQYSHSLLQALIMHHKCHQPAIIVHMYLNGTIQLSEHSMRTLNVIIKFCDLPETLEAFHNVTSRVSSYHHKESLRCALLDWLLPNKEDVSLTELRLVPFSPEFMSELLVELIIKTQSDTLVTSRDTNPRSDQILVTNSIEDDYNLTSFEMGLLISDKCGESTKYTNVKSDQNNKLVIPSAKDKLIELLKRDCNVLIEREITPQESKIKLKILIDYISQCILIAGILSWFLSWNIITNYALPTFSLTLTLRKIMEKFAASARALLSQSKMDTNLTVMYTVMHETCKLFEADLQEDIERLMQEFVPVELLDAVYGILRKTQIPERSLFPEKMDIVDGIMENSNSDVIDEASCSLMDVQLLTEEEKVHLEAVKLLCLYCCCFTGTELTGQSREGLSNLLSLLSNPPISVNSVCYFQMASFVTVRCQNCPTLSDEHVNLVLKVIQKLCYARHQDTEAANIILQLLCGVFRHVQDKTSKQNSLVLLKAFQKNINKHKYGPETCVKFLKCLGELPKVDPNFLWTKWESGTRMEGCDLGGNLTPVTEELLVYVKSPFHEVRMAAAGYISTLFSRETARDLLPDEKHKWQKRMFENLFNVIKSSFIVEGELNMEEKVDESANRTASALHCYAVLMVVSPQWRKKALFAILRLVKEKNLNTELVQKVLNVVGKNLKLPSIVRFMETNLNYLIIQWYEMTYSFQDFPCMLFNCASNVNFYTKYEEIIVPILLQKEDDESLNLISIKINKSMAEMVKGCYPRIIACLVPCFAANASDGLGNLPFAKRLYPKLEQILSKEIINDLLTQQLDKVIVNILRLLFDEQHFVELCGGSKEALSDPDPLYFKYSVVMKSLIYLQENSPKRDLPLVVFLSQEISGHIQKILLSLAVDIHEAPTLEDKLKSLGRYATFASILSKELGDGNGLGRMNTFVIRDISHTLIHLMNLSYQKSEFPLAVAACHFYRQFCSKCFPAFASVLESFLMVIVSTLVPLAKSEGDLALESQLLLRFLIVEKSEHLSSAIEMLDPFPDDAVFHEINEVYMQIKRSRSVDSLEETIKHFLNIGSKNLGNRAEGLKHLRTQLSEKKQELSMLYNDLNDMRGFSEDCSRSLLHRLICMLVELTSVTDSKISLEASRCLGELGPADLTTMVLKPEKSQELQDNFTDNPVFMFTAHVVQLLVEYLVDENIKVVDAASTALYKVLARREGQQIIDASNKVDVEFLYPFKMEKPAKRDSNIVVNEDHFQATVNEAIWCPIGDCTHENWITTLVCAILGSFPENCFISQLIRVCEVKVFFAEQIIPYLVALILSKGGDVCTAVLNKCICHFFKKHFEKHCQFSKEQGTANVRYAKEHVCFNRASVQCMLNVVQFVRLQKSLKNSDGNGSPNSKNLDLNYLHVAEAAQFCSAYFTSIMYAELWCNDLRERNIIPHTGGQSMSELEYIYEKKADSDALALQNILKEAYKKIGDNDAIYGCGSADMLDPHSRIAHYELTGNWQNALLSYDIELSSGREEATGGMLFTLQRLGLHHHLYENINNKPYTVYESYQYECAWRLGQWNILTTGNKKSISSSAADNNLDFLISKEYEKHHYLCLKALHDLDLNSVEKEVVKARQCVINSLIHASLESSKNLYQALSQLQPLQEIEDFISSNGNLDIVMEKWKKQSLLSHNDFSYIEPILTQRGVLLNNALQVEKDETIRQKLTKSLADIQLSTAKLARTEGWLHVGDRCLSTLQKVGGLAPIVEVQLKLEAAQLSWSRGDHDIGRRILRALIGELSSCYDESQEKMLLYSNALKLYGNWMVETKSENPQVIVDRYFGKAQNILEGMNYNGESRLEAYTSLARFVDAQYQQLMSLLKSSSFEIKRQYLKKARDEAQKLRQQKQCTVDERRKIHMNEKTSIIEQKEIENTEKDKDMYLKLALKNYLMSLEHGAEHNLQVFRLASLWLENTNNEVVSEVLDMYLHHIPSYKFLPVVPQLAPHIGNKTDDIFTRQLNGLLERCAVEHPHHTLPVILALANSHKDKEYTGGSKNEVTSEPRVLGAQIMVQNFTKRQEVNAIVKQMEAVASALIALAYYDIGQSNKKSTSIPKKVLNQLKSKELVLVPTMTIPLRHNCRYDDIVGIHKYGDDFSLVGGINAPKKISCFGTDGIERAQLVKGKDDLRQDAVMQQVFTILNTLLKNNKETKKRKLLIRTYKIIPLSQRSGVLEWCENTQPLAAYLIGTNGAHQRYYPNDRSPKQCREDMTKVAQESNEAKLRTYNEICKTFHPVFRCFFLENFPSPGVWFERRLAYIHSVATSSMIGYILGLGDRHTVNILIDKSTAEVIHIDFGIAFEQGHILPTPETVPFRLTRDIEDGMGVSGIEGVFRRCCEKTMSVLRQNQETIITILEVLLYDPLYAWTISPSKAYNIQSARRADLENSNTQTTEGEVNQMAERALIRLRQKLQGTEEGTATSISGQVNRLIQQARDPVNLCRLFQGWQPYL